MSGFAKRPRQWSPPPRWKKVWADIWHEPARSLMIVVSIAVGALAIGIIAGSFYLIPRSMDYSYQVSGAPQISLSTSPFDDDFVDGVEAMPEVLAAEGSRNVTVRARMADDIWEVMTIEAIPDYSDKSILRPHYVAGDTELHDGEMLIGRKTADRWELAIGDTITVELTDGTLRDIRIIGIVQDMSGSPDSFLASNLAWVHYDALEWLHVSGGWTKLRVQVAESPESPEHLQAVADEITDRLERTGRWVYRTSYNKSLAHPLSYIVTAIIGILGLLGVLVLFLAGTLVTNTFNALLAQHMRQIGVIKLVGGRRDQIVPMYLAMITAYSLVALAIAIPAASWGAAALAEFATDLLNLLPAEGTSLTPLAVVLQSIVALGIPLLTGLGPVLRGTRLSVQKALSGGEDLGSEEIDEGPLDRAVSRTGARSRPLMISLRNTFRRKGRLALTLITLTMGGSIFIAVFSSDLATELKVIELTRYFTADVNVNLAHDYRVQEIAELTLQVPGVAEVEPWSGGSAELLAPDDRVLDAVSVVAPPADSPLVTPIMLDGRWFEPGESLAVAVNDNMIRDYPELTVGSTLRLRMDDRVERWTIVGVFQHMGNDTLLAYTDHDALADWLNEPGLASSYRIVMDQHGLDNQIVMAEALDALYRDAGYEVSRVQAGDAFAKDMTDVLNVLTIILLVMALLTALVGAIGLAGTLSMNVMERTREIGVMRAIGAHNRIVVRLVIVEGLMIGLLSYLLGVAVSVPISAILSGIICEAIFGSAAPFAFSWMGVLIWLGVVVVLSVVASILPAKNASRLTIREVLAYE